MIKTLMPDGTHHCKGTKGETKPVDLLAGSDFLEDDTCITFWWNGLVWTPTLGIGRCLDGTDSAVPGFKTLSAAPSTLPESLVDIDIPAGGGNPRIVTGTEYLTEEGTPGTTAVRVGTVQSHLWTKVDSAAGECVLRSSVFRRNAAGLLTLLLEFDTPPLTTTLARYDIDYMVTVPILLLTGDRLMMRVSGVRTVGNQARKVSYTIGGTLHASFLGALAYGHSAIT